MAQERDVVARLRALEGVTVLWSCSQECWERNVGHSPGCYPIVPAVVEDSIAEILDLRQRLAVWEPHLV